MKRAPARARVAPSIATHAGGDATDPQRREVRSESSRGGALAQSLQDPSRRRLPVLVRARPLGFQHGAEVGTPSCRSTSRWKRPKVINARPRRDLWVVTKAFASCDGAAIARAEVRPSPLLAEEELGEAEEHRSDVPPRSCEVGSFHCSASTESQESSGRPVLALPAHGNFLMRRSCLDDPVGAGHHLVDPSKAEPEALRFGLELDFAVAVT